MAYVDKSSPVTEEECIAVIDQALELGCTHLDTSDVRGLYHAAVAHALSDAWHQIDQLLVLRRISCHRHDELILNSLGLPAGLWSRDK